MRRSLRLLLITVFLALPAQLQVLGAPPTRPMAAGATYVVDSTNDTSDADLGNPACADADHHCTLRAAVMQANVATGVNTITVPSGIFLLTRPGAEDGAVLGDLDITNRLTIQGAGPGLTIVDGNSNVTHDRVFQVLDSAADVTIMDLTIRNGSVPTSGVSGPSRGGGILADSTSGFLQLTLNNVILEGNFALTGGGLYASAAHVSLKNSTVRRNVADAGGGTGGGIYAAFGGSLTIQDSQVYSNTAYGGGGLDIEGNANTDIMRSQIYSNTAASFGGGIANSATFAFPDSPLKLTDSRLHDNLAGYSGGAINTRSSLALTRTALDTNHALYFGGGIYITAGNGSTLSIQKSTLSRNNSRFGGAIAYDGTSIAAQTLTLENSTLSNNVASHDGAGIYAVERARVQLFNDTIAGNLLSLAYLATNPLRGGGVFITDTAVITAQNTLIANNLFTDNSSHSGPDDCFTSATPTLHSLGYNLVETTTNCSFSGTTFGNITGMDPMLGPLQFNGGSTQTQALLVGSPAIDTAQTLTPGCTDHAGAPLTTDQRGWLRPHGAHCDIGAFEYYPPALWIPLIRR